MSTMTQHIAREALSVASLVAVLADLPHETRAVVTATENGKPWAHVHISPMTDTARAVFPVDADGVRGDTRKRGQSGVMVQGAGARDALTVVVNRARLMAQV